MFKLSPEMQWMILGVLGVIVGIVVHFAHTRKSKLLELAGDMAQMAQEVGLIWLADICRDLEHEKWHDAIAAIRQRRRAASLKDRLKQDFQAIISSYLEHHKDDPAELRKIVIALNLDAAKVAAILSPAVSIVNPVAGAAIGVAGTVASSVAAGAK